MLFWPIFGNCGCPVETLVTFSSNLSSCEKYLKIQKNQKNYKKNLKAKIKKNTIKVFKKI